MAPRCVAVGGYYAIVWQTVAEAGHISVAPIAQLKARSKPVPSSLHIRQLVHSSSIMIGRIGKVVLKMFRLFIGATTVHCLRRCVLGRTE